MSELVVDLIEAEEDEVSSSLPDKPRQYRKASSKLPLLRITRTCTLQKYTDKIESEFY